VSLKNSNDTIGNRTRDLPVCSLVHAFTVSLLILLRMRNVSENISTENQNTFCVHYFSSENLTVYEIMWKKW
jgi:hypothetical protein